MAKKYTIIVSMNIRCEDGSEEIIHEAFLHTGLSRMDKEAALACFVERFEPRNAGDLPEREYITLKE